MNCQAVQNQILMLPDPRELSPALREHVRACAACQEWAQHAARLETMLERLPAPPAPEQKKEMMIGELMQADPVIYPMPKLATQPSYGLLAVRFLRRNVAYAGGLAAAILVAVGVYSWLARPSTVQPEIVKVEKYPLLEKMVAHDIALTRAKTSVDRLEILNRMADDLSANTRDMARIASGPELKQMAGWYDKTVTTGMMEQANKLPNSMSMAEKKKLLESYAAKLNANATAAETLAREAPPDAQPALNLIADSARKGEKSLRATAREGK